jgi:phosphoglycolate phosphatase
MSAHPHLLLFDIDGTLVDTGGAGMAAIVTTREELYAEELRRVSAPDLDLAGSTDSGIVMEMFEKIGVTDSEEERRRFYGCYLGHLLKNLGEPGTRGILLEGVTALLEALDAEVESGRALVGLLTGNIAKGARVKVDYYGVGRHFAFGSYGDDHHDRNLLGPIAVGRAADHAGLDLGSAPVTVIGDTAKDIRCARAFGARVLAVATGSISRENLASHDPDVLLDDLADTGRAMAALGFD